MFRALVFVAVFLLGCTDRPDEQETDSGEPEQEILQRRCELLIECGYGPSYATVSACILDQKERLSHWETPECAPALLDFFACGNKADSCEAYWVLHSLVEKVNGECRPLKDEVCRWDCGCVGTDHDS